MASNNATFDRHLHIKSRENEKSKKKVLIKDIDFDMLKQLKQLSYESKYILSFEFEVNSIFVILIEPKEEVRIKIVKIKNQVSFKKFINFFSN